MDSQFTSLKEELQDMRKKYDDLGYYHAFKNRMIDDTPMCERHEANYIQSEGCQNQDSHSCQSHYDSNDFEKSLTELNNDVKNDLEDFKRCIRSMRTVHSKLYEIDDQSKTDLEKTITKFLDVQKVANMTDPPPPPQAQTEHVNVVFTKSEESDDSPKTKKYPPPPIIVNNKIERDKPIKTSKRGYYVVETKEYPFRLNAAASVSSVVTAVYLLFCRLSGALVSVLKLYECAGDLLILELVLEIITSPQ
ncbi:hypothetical protein Tco_0740742 [Tanacetum coccineum]